MSKAKQSERGTIMYHLGRIGCWLYAFALLGTTAYFADNEPLFVGSLIVDAILLPQLVVFYLWYGDMIWLIDAENRRNLKLPSSKETEAEPKETEAERKIRMEAAREQDAKDLNRGLMVIGLVIVVVLVMLAFSL